MLRAWSLGFRIRAMGDPNVPKIGPSAGVLGSDIGFSGGSRALVFKVSALGF